MKANNKIGATAAVILNGGGLPAGIEGDYIICADGGYDLLTARGVRCDVLLGDFDSIKHGVLSDDIKHGVLSNGFSGIECDTSDLNGIKRDTDGFDVKREGNLDVGQKGNIKVIRYNTDKDMTDGELAVRHAVKAGCAEINIYGADGGTRPDHIAGNYNLLYLAHVLGASARILGEGYSVRYVDKSVELKTGKGDTVSILPYSDSARVNYSRGLKYPLDGLVFLKHSSLGLSNEAVGDSVFIELSDGSALLFHVENRKPCLR